MLNDFDTISKNEIIKKLSTNSLVKEITVFDTIDSTNTYLKANSQSAQDGTVVIAKEQTGGRGRLGRSFYSPKDTGIYMSIFLTPDMPLCDVNLITICCAVAAVRTLKKVCNLDTKIKWVNDIFAGASKICGILTEASTDTKTGDVLYVVAGVGINISTDSFPDDIKNIASSVCKYASATFTKNDVIAEFLNEFEKVYTPLLRGGKNKIVDEYKENLFVLGKRVTVISANETYEAVAEDVNENANLIIKLNDGTYKTLVSGEISIKL